MSEKLLVEFGGVNPSMDTLVNLSELYECDLDLLVSQKNQTVAKRAIYLARQLREFGLIEKSLSDPRITVRAVATSVLDSLPEDMMWSSLDKMSKDVSPAVRRICIEKLSQTNSSRAHSILEAMVGNEVDDVVKEDLVYYIGQFCG